MELLKLDFWKFDFRGLKHTLKSWKSIICGIESIVQGLKGRDLVIFEDLFVVGLIKNLKPEPVV